MRKLILAICLTALLSTANATPVGFIANKAGGQIVFTTDVCKDRGQTYQGLLRAFTFDRSGMTAEACYYLDNKTDLLMLIWADTRERSVFRLSDLTPY
jgi:hypothetical protein